MVHSIIITWKKHITAQWYAVIESYDVTMHSHPNRGQKPFLSIVALIVARMNFILEKYERWSNSTQNW